MKKSLALLYLVIMGLTSAVTPVNNFFTSTPIYAATVSSKESVCKQELITKFNKLEKYVNYYSPDYETNEKMLRNYCDQIENSDDLIGTLKTLKTDLVSKRYTSKLPQYYVEYILEVLNCDISYLEYVSKHTPTSAEVANAKKQAALTGITQEIHNVLKASLSEKEYLDFLFQKKRGNTRYVSKICFIPNSEEVFSSGLDLISNMYVEQNVGWFTQAYTNGNFCSYYIGRCKKEDYILALDAYKRAYQGKKFTDAQLKKFPEFTEHFSKSDINSPNFDLNVSCFIEETHPEYLVIEYIPASSTNAKGFTFFNEAEDITVTTDNEFNRHLYKRLDDKEYIETPYGHVYANSLDTSITYQSMDAALYKCLVKEGADYGFEPEDYWWLTPMIYNRIDWHYPDKHYYVGMAQHNGFENYFRVNWTGSVNNVVSIEIQGRKKL